MSVNKVNSDGSLSRVAGGTLYADAPIGAISPFGGSNVPSGYLLCNGQAVSRTNYAELFAVIGTAFGTGDGSTTFNIPDLREATTKGVGLNNKGAYHYDNDGIALGEFVDDRIKSHAHNVYVRDSGHAHGIDYVNGQFTPGVYGLITPYLQAGGDSFTRGDTAKIQVSSTSNFSSIDNSTTANGSATNEVKAVGVNYIIKAKQVAVPIDLINAVNDMIKETTYECRGFLINGYADTIRGNGHAVVTLKNGIAKIEFSAKIERNDATPDDYTGWGLNWNLLRYHIPELPEDIIPKMENSKLQYFSETGTLLTDLMGYSAIGVPSPPWWQPYKMHESGGSISSLRPSQFPVGSYIMGTVYGTYTV